MSHWRERAVRAALHLGGALWTVACSWWRRLCAPVGRVCRKVRGYARHQHGVDRTLFGYSLYASFLLAPPQSWRLLRWNNPFAWLLRWRVTPAHVYLGALLVGWPVAWFFGHVVPDTTNVTNYVLIVPSYWALSYAFYNQVEVYWSQLVENGYFTRSEIEQAQRRYRVVLQGALLPVAVVVLAGLVQGMYFEHEVVLGQFEKWRNALVAVAPVRPPSIHGFPRRLVVGSPALAAFRQWERLVANAPAWATVRQPSPWFLAWYLGVQGLSLFMLVMMGTHAIVCGYLLRDLFFGPGRRRPVVDHWNTRWGLSGHGRLAMILDLLLGDIVLNLYLWRENLDQSAVEWLVALCWYSIGPALIILYMLPAHRFMTWHKRRLLDRAPLPRDGDTPPTNSHRQAVAKNRGAARLATWPISVRGVIGLVLAYLQFLITTYARIQLFKP